MSDAGSSPAVWTYMLYRLFFILCIVFSYTCFAESSDFVLYKNHGHIKFLSSEVNDESHKLELDIKKPFWSWERRAISNGLTATKCYVFAENNNTHILFDIDLMGPDWLYLELIYSDKGFSLKAKNTKDKLTINLYFDNYDELEKSEEFVAKCVVVMIYRTQVHLLDLETIAIIDFKKPCKADPKVVDECLDIIKQLDSKNWRVRKQAFKELCDIKFMKVLPLMAKNKLSVQQRALLDRCKLQYHTEVSEEQFPLLEKIVRSTGSW